MRAVSIFCGLIFLFIATVNAQPVIIYGDTRTNYDVHRRIVKEIQKQSPMAVFHTGDLVENGFSIKQWKLFESITAELRNDAAFYPVLGNHELGSPMSERIFDTLSTDWYSVNVDSIHFICMNTNHQIKVGDKQYKWLESDLKKATDGAQYVIVITHHPPYSSGKHKPDSQGLRKSIVPLFEKYKVDIVFSGHDHSYERLHDEYCNIYYVVTGGGGAPLYDQFRSIDKNVINSQVFHKKYHYCKLKRNHDHLWIDVIDIEGVVIDQFIVLRKNRN